MEDISYLNLISCKVIRWGVQFTILREITRAFQTIVLLVMSFLFFALFDIIWQMKWNEDSG